MCFFSADLDCTYLEHLDEGYTEIKVCQITADKTQTEEEANGYDGAEVDPSGHWNRVSRVERSSESCHELGHDRREEEMPCRKENCCCLLARPRSTKG